MWKCGLEWYIWCLESNGAIGLSIWDGGIFGPFITVVTNMSKCLWQLWANVCGKYDQIFTTNVFRYLRQIYANICVLIWLSEKLLHLSTSWSSPWSHLEIIWSIINIFAVIVIFVKYRQHCHHWHHCNQQQQHHYCQNSLKLLQKQKQCPQNIFCLIKGAVMEDAHLIKWYWDSSMSPKEAGVSAHLYTTCNTWKAPPPPSRACWAVRLFPEGWNRKETEGGLPHHHCIAGR